MYIINIENNDPDIDHCHFTLYKGLRSRNIINGNHHNIRFFYLLVCFVLFFIIIVIIFL